MMMMMMMCRKRKFTLVLKEMRKKASVFSSVFQEIQNGVKKWQKDVH